MTDTLLLQHNISGVLGTPAPGEYPITSSFRLDIERYGNDAANAIKFTLLEPSLDDIDEEGKAIWHYETVWANGVTYGNLTTALPDNTIPLRNPRTDVVIRSEVTTTQFGRDLIDLFIREKILCDEPYLSVRDGEDVHTVYEMHPTFRRWSGL